MSAVPVRRSFMLVRQDAQILLVPGNFTIGRSSACDLAIDDPLVSRVHAVVRVGIDSAVLEDAGSSNGVFVNGQRIDKPHALADGDRIGIGSEELKVTARERTAKRPSRDRTMSRAQAAAVESALSGQAKAADPRLAQLSEREREVLVMVARGHTMREIAEQLGLSPKTVEGYRARLGDKLGLRTRAEIVRFALDAGLLRP